METLLQSNFTNVTEGHVFYRFQDGEAYLDHLVSFINTGLDRNEQILILESMRNLPKISAIMNSLFTVEQQSSIHLVNNYDYYISNGDFNTQTILEHFEKDLPCYNNSNSSIRTWAHVEWVSTESNAQLITNIEVLANNFVIQERMVSVCAYSSASLSSSLNDALEQDHKYIMSDDDFSLSSLYEK
ncbi:MEDS domain-containing protein [Bacillus sp. JJ1122]|uniref:MEDS domain-containing protein n=1 Tax=Bacillus sp. JJ1122 TaxID=3122951 RepID=UPI002FFF52D6